MRNRARLFRQALATVALGASVLGMGALGGGHDPGTPSRDFRGVLTDVDGTRIEVNRLTLGSDTTVDGELGRGRLRVPFDQITRVAVVPLPDHGSWCAVVIGLI